MRELFVTGATGLEPALRTGRAPVLRLLAELADVYANDDGVIALTREELGQIAGTTRATVNRVLREQEERGTVALKRGQTSLDRESLPHPGVPR